MKKCKRFETGIPIIHRFDLLFFNRILETINLQKILQAVNFFIKYKYNIFTTKIIDID